MPKHYAKPEYSRNEVNRAGEILVDPKATNADMDQALVIINNWRAAHHFPLNTFQMRLRTIARAINPSSLVAQRIKRLASIKAKLQDRFHSMKLVQMQDIGGCRAIMKNVQEVDRIVNKYRHESRGLKHELAKEDDYLVDPQSTGYRGVHLIYKYKSISTKDYENLRIEIQLRSLMQHAWATAVETVGTFKNEALKSGVGNPEWLRFFVVMSSAMAIIEGKPVVPNTSENFSTVQDEIKYLSEKLQVKKHLIAFTTSIRIFDEGSHIGNYYYLLDLQSDERFVTIKTYAKNQLETATRDYLTLEKRLAENRNAVLVSADSIEALRLAYPNYYLDTDYFVLLLDKITTIKTLSEFYEASTKKKKRGPKPID